jgi:DNA repair protein RadD
LLQEKQVPKVELFDVRHLAFSKNPGRNGKPPTLRVSYYTDGMLRHFVEYVCIEHPDFPGSSAREWWRARSIVPNVVPQTVDDALRLALDGNLRIPKRIRVWMNNKPKPKVIGHEF